MKRLLTILGILTYLAPASVLAAEDGGLEGQFLNWGAGARALGLGKAYVAIADDATASYWNPAGLMQLERMGMSALHAALWEGITYDFVSFAMPTLADGAFGFNTAMIAVGGADKRDSENNLLTGELRSTKVASTFSYARSFGVLGHFGFSVTHLGRWLDTWQTGFLTGSFGWLAKLLPDLSAGFVVQHLVSFRYGDTEDALPWLGKIGFAYRVIDQVLLAGDLDHNGAWHLGMEMTPAGPFSLRLGTDRYETSAGAGVLYDDVGIDYAAGFHQFLGLSHRLSLQFQWGDSAKLIRLQQAREKYFQAVEAMGKGEGEKALQAVREATALDPENEAARWLEQRLQSSPPGR